MTASKLVLIGAFALSMVARPTPAQAAGKELLQGSDTLAGAMSDAIIAAGLDSSVGYVGGGSGTGEAAIVNGTQGIAAMSRAFKPEASQALIAKHASVIEHVLGLDGVSLFVNGTSRAQGLSIATIRDIFTCKITNWQDVPLSGAVGAIHAFRRNDKSGTTDTIKNLAGISAFGACVQIVEETADIAERTSNDALAIGYAGLSAKRDGNKVLPVSATGTNFVTPTAATIRSFAYPLSRKLFVYEVSGALKPSTVESQLLERLTDRSFMDPIIQANEFFTVN